MLKGSNLLLYGMDPKSHTKPFLELGRGKTRLDQILVCSTLLKSSAMRSGYWRSNMFYIGPATWMPSQDNHRTISVPTEGQSITKTRGQLSI